MAIHEHDATRTLFGHPIGLTNLFGVELWERFSFYGMLTILGYYLYYSATDGGLGLPQSTATGIVGAYGGLTPPPTPPPAGSRAAYSPARVMKLSASRACTAPPALP